MQHILSTRLHSVHEEWSMYTFIHIEESLCLVHNLLFIIWNVCQHPHIVGFHSFPPIRKYCGILFPFSFSPFPFAYGWGDKILFPPSRNNLNTFFHSYFGDEIKWNGVEVGRGNGIQGCGILISIHWVMEFPLWVSDLQAMNSNCCFWMEMTACQIKYPFATLPLSGNYQRRNKRQHNTNQLIPLSFEQPFAIVLHLHCT